MKYTILALILICGLAFGDQSKIIIAKENPIENRFSAADFLFGNGSITKSETVYYLVAEDGTVCEVTVSKWAKTKIGDSFLCPLWVEKD